MCVIVFYHIIVPCVCVCGLFPAPTRWGLRDRKNKLRVCRRDECADVLTSFHLLYVLRTTPSCLWWRTIPPVTFTAFKCTNCLFTLNGERKKKDMLLPNKNVAFAVLFSTTWHL